MSNSNHPRKSHQIIRSYEARALRKRTITQRLADWFTSYFGSVAFLVLNLIFFIIWLAINLNLIPGISIFDPYPFVLLITAVSLEAIFLAVIVLISQNRENQIATIRDEMQLQVELITEKEISKVLSLLKKILENQGEKVTDVELDEMIQTIDTSYIEKKLQAQLTNKISSNLTSDTK